MQKNLRLTILVMALFSILLFLLIIGPEVSGAIAVSENEVSGAIAISENNVYSFKPDIVDSGNEPTGSAIEKDDSPTDVTSEIAEPKAAFQLKYDQYPLTYVYLLIQNDAVNIRKDPSLTEAVLKTASKNEKLNYIETVTNDGTWYHVTWQEAGQQFFGFTNADVVTKRVFQFDKMHQEVLKVEKASGTGPLTYIGNYITLEAGLRFIGERNWIKTADGGAKALRDIPIRRI
jgi:hypothetical protein